MNLRPLLIAALPLGLAAAAPAMAGDSRIATRLFNPDEVVRIAGRTGVQASVVMGEDERIENVAIGDSTAWQVTPNKRANVLFVKPLAPRAQTNMTVITDRHTYLFDLVAGTSASPVYVLRFTYPVQERPAVAAAGTAPVLTETETEALTDKVRDAAVDPAKLNFAWARKGKAALMPARIYDDGQSTFLGWEAKVPIPAIQIRNDAGVEGPVNFAVRDDVLVIEGVPGEIVLRSGRDVATLKRTAPPAAAPAPAPTSAGTPPAALAAAATPEKDR